MIRKRICLTVMSAIVLGSVYMPISAEASVVTGISKSANAQIPVKTSILAEATISTEAPMPTTSLKPTGTPEQTETPRPTVAPKRKATPKPTAVPKLKVTPKPAAVPKPKDKVKRLKRVKDIKLIRYSTNVVKVTWRKSKAAKYYRIYYTCGEKGTPKLAGVTQNVHFLVKKLKNHRTYYFYVTARKEKKTSASESLYSKGKKITMRTYRRKIVFGGDSITEGIGYGYCHWRMGGIKKIVAYRGLNTITFHTKRIFKGRTGLQKVIAENPYRAYMMLGVNEIHYRRANDIITEYRAMVRNIQRSCPRTDIVLCAIAPVTRAERARCPGYKQIPAFNGKLKKLAQQMGVNYLDYTAFLKDSSGCLRTEYAERDGYHWKLPVYAKFAREIERYEKMRDA